MSFNVIKGFMGRATKKRVKYFGISTSSRKKYVQSLRNITLGCVLFKIHYNKAYIRFNVIDACFS